MFDFFSEIIEFFNQVVEWLNWFISFIFGTLENAGTALKSVSNIITGFPAPFAALLTLCLSATVFEFIRGR